MIHISLTPLSIKGIYSFTRK